MNKNELLVRVEGLTKQFGTLKAVDDLSFSIHRGDVYGFLGQNGAGKSTTIRILLSLIAPTSGTVELFGYPLKTHRKEVLRKIGAIIERPDHYRYLTAFENLRLFAQMSGCSSKREVLMEKLDLVGLASRAESKVGTYSQGMKQRLGIAIALVQDPELIILDEPTNGLDPQGIADIRNLLLLLSRSLHKTILISSHLLNEVEQVATRMLIIDKGKKMVEGSVDALFYPSEMLVELETDAPEVCFNLLQQSDFANASLNQKGPLIELQIQKQRIPILTRFLVQNNLGVLGIASKNKLEDYFLKLTSANQHVDPYSN